MSQSVRSRLNVECLESRDVPSTVTQTFDTITPPALPSGWTEWSNDGSTVFATAAGQGVSGSVGVVSSGVSRTAGLAWPMQTQSGDTAVSADVQLNSLIPTFVFARGTNLGTAAPSYIAAVVTRGATVSVMKVTNGTSTLLGTVASPSSAYFSGNWVNVSLVPNGSSVAVQVMRFNTNQYLNAQGTWQSAVTNAIAVSTTLADSASDVGIGRVAAYSGSVDLDNFAIAPPSQVTAPTVSEQFDTTAIGATPTGWQSWVSNGAGTAGVSSSLALSQPNSYALSGSSNTAVRAWSTTPLPAAVSASVAVDLNSLIPAQLFVDGANLNTSTPTYDAVTLTRGVQASLVQVVNGTTTTLATLTSSGYLSGQWVQVELTAQGTDLLATIYRTDTNQWLTSSGTWSSAPTYAFNVQNAANLSVGEAGIGRAASYAGTTNFDNFTAGAVGTVGPAVAVSSSTGSGSVSGSVTFQATATGNVSQMAFILNGQVLATSTSSTASWTLNSNALANGSYTLTVLAGGTDGTVGAGEYSFTVANTPPLPPPPPPSATNPDQITINANPTSSVGYSPAPSTDTLFGPNGPSYLDVEQGQEGDCWLIASLAEVAAQAPQDIVNMFTYDGTTVENGSTVGVYTVRFFNSNNVPRYVTVDTQLPKGGSYYDQTVNGVLWVALAEKAYAVANGLGYVSTSDKGSNSYDALNSGYSYWALQAITGQSASDNNINPAQIAANWNAGDFVVLSTVSPTSSQIVGDHDYAVVGYNASSGLFELMNPWGGTTTSNLCPQDSQVYGLFSANASFLSANFSMQYIGAGTANQRNDSLPLAELGGSNFSGQSSTILEGRLSNGPITANSSDTLLDSPHKTHDGDSDISWSTGGFVG